MIKRKGIGGTTVLLVETYTELRKIMNEQGSNILHVATETRDFITYFRITLKRFAE